MRNLVGIMIVLIVICTACGRKTKDELYAEGVKQFNAANPNGAVVLFKKALEKDENYVDARFMLAKSYALIGKSEQAEKEFMKVLKQNPSRDDVMPELAAIYNMTDKPEQAFKLGEQYLGKHPGSVEGFEILGVSSAVAKKYSDAEQYLFKAITADPSRMKTKLELAKVYASNGKEQKAKELLEQLAKADQKNLRALHMLASLELKNGNSDKALGIYRTIQMNDASDTVAIYKIGLIHIVKGEVEKADKIADDLIKAYPKRAEGHRLKGLVSYGRKNYADALTYLQTSLSMGATPDANFYMGLSYYNRGELESALSQFRIILDRIPTFRQARIMTATILLAQKRIDDAISEIQKQLQQDDRDALAHNLLGSAYMAKGMFDEGMRELKIATTIDPKIVDAYVKRGAFYFSKGKTSAGETELVSAVNASPDALGSRMMLASYHVRSANTAKALSVLRAGVTGKKSDAVLLNGIAALLFSLNKQDDALQTLQKAKETDPAFPATYQNIANYYASAGRYDKAIEEYASFLRIEPQNYKAMLNMASVYEVMGNDGQAVAFYKKAMETRQPTAYLGQAYYYLKKKDTDKALKVLEEASKIDSRNVAVLELRGRLLVSMKKYKEALKVYEELETVNSDTGIAMKIRTYLDMNASDKAVNQAHRLIQKYPRSARGYMVLASIYEHQKDHSRAINELRNGLKMEPDNVNALVYLGELFEAKKEYGEAMSTYESALRRQPGYLPAIFRKASLLESMGKKKESVAKYRELVTVSDQYVPALNNLAYLYADGYGSKEDALRLAMTAYKLDPGNAGVMDTLGYALLKNNRKEEAKKVLEKAFNLRPGNPTVAYHLAVAYKETGDRVNAVETLKKAVARGDFPEARLASDLLASLK